MTDTTTDFFDGVSGGAGAPTAELKNVGDFAYGEVLEMFKRDYVPFGAKEPEKKEDGTTRQQLVIILQTEQRNWAGVSRVPQVDPADPTKGQKPPSDDDGKRAVYVPEGKNIQFAIGRAVQASGARFEVGGTLGVKIDNLKDTGKGNPLKEHVATYKGKPEGFFGGGQQSAPAAQAEPTPAAPAAQSAPAAQGGDPWASTSGGASNPPPF